jgi:MFS family permease
MEGLGAVLIMPAIVALVASNFARPQRPRAYGIVAAAGAIAAALGPLIGGAFTTYASWRKVTTATGTQAGCAPPAVRCVWPSAP